MINASVYIIAQDEERHIERCLKSVSDFSEIIVVDSGSTDNTINIAEKYGARVIRQPFLGYSAQKEFAKNQCSQKWVLNLDADEQLSPKLKEQIASSVATDADFDALEIPILSYYLGALPHRLTHPIYRVRFFKKSNGFYPEKLVHESVKITGKIAKSPYFIYDYGLVDIQKQIEKINIYSSLRADEKAAKNRRASLFKLLFAAPAAFVKSYFLRRQFLNGKRGFILSAVLAFYAFLKEAKLYEKNQTD